MSGKFISDCIINYRSMAASNRQGLLCDTGTSSTPPGDPLAGAADRLLATGEMRTAPEPASCKRNV